jgi:sugar lactone lactonase YvrE
MSQIECVVDAKQELGEGPVWCTRENALFWVDIRGPRVHKYDPSSGQTEAWTLPSAIGSFALRDGTGMLLALKSGLHGYDRATGALDFIADPETDRPNNRFNDGKCDRQGRFWVGTMRDDEREPSGALYRVDADLSCRRVQDGLTIPNSLAWSPDGRTMYFTDTAEGRILVYDYDVDEGQPGAPRVFAEAKSAAGHPDGSTVDEAGCLWNARYAGSSVVRFTPDGRVDRVVELPVSQVTCCAFGGAALDTLFITTATQRMSPEARAAEPLAGGLFAVNLGIKGVAEPRFAG